jgi:signal transduction histidine kinase
MGLQKKIIIYAAISLAALMSLLTWISSQTNTQATEMVHQERLALAKNIASSADSIIEDLRAEVSGTAAVLGADWTDNLTEAGRRHLVSLASNLRVSLASSSSGLTMPVALLDAQGEVLWTEPYLAGPIGQSLADTDSVRWVIQRGQFFVGAGDARFTRSRSTSLFLVYPVTDGRGIQVGLLLAEVPLETENSFSAFLRRQAGDYRLELVSDDGNVIASSVPGVGAGQSSVWDSVRRLAGQRVAGVVTRQLPGRDEALVAFAPLSGVSWGLILERPGEQTLVLPWVGGRPLLVSTLVLFLAAGLMWLVTRQIVTPLRRLAATAQKFGSGDLDAAIPVTGHDEIGELAESLDTMRRQLKRSLDEIGEWNRELEQRVKQRTQALELLDQQLREQNKERGELLRKIITTQEEERRRIARELHDEVGQSITSLMIGFRVLETQDPEQMKKGIADLKRLSAKTLDEVRHLAIELRPSSLDDLGLIPALRQYTREYADKFGISADFQASGFEGRRLRPEIEIALYRIVQEALTNVARHSDARKASVLMGVRNSSIVAIVEDDGKGFDVQGMLASKNTARKLGLYGMQERASLIGGQITIESAPGKGTTVFVEVPLEGDEAR